MPLSDQDVREILRIIDESPLQELHVETGGFVLHVRKDESGSDPAAEGGATSVPAPAPGAPDPDEQPAIAAPMLGTFYRAEGPGQQPFVEIGSRVEPDTIVCIIEVMKMMNSVPAGVSGTIVEVCPQNAELVEFGQPLFRVQTP